MVVKEGLDLHEVKVAWAEFCKYQTVMNQLRISVLSVERRELQVEWHTDPETIGQSMAQLKKRPEYAGSVSVIDLHEEDRTSACQEQLRQLQEKKRKVQEEEEAPEHLAKLQPPVCSLDGIFRAAELGDLAALDAHIKGYPLPVYDHHTGASLPNPDRLAPPVDRHHIRIAKQRAHTVSKLQHRHAESQAVGDPMDDLRSAAPHLFRGAGGGGEVTASFDLRDAFGKTPLHIATAAGQVEMVRRLLELGADPDAEEREGVSAVQLAALKGDIEASKVLLAAGAALTGRSGDGRTVVHFAAAGGSEAYMDWLLFSKDTQRQETWRLVGERAADGSTVLHALATADASTKERQSGVNGVAKKIFRAWLGVMEQQAGELLDAVDDTGSTPLHICAKVDSFELLRYLTSLGASPNLQARSGDIPMHVAVRKQTLASITFLASAGSDSSIANIDGDTPLHIAATVPSKAVFKLCMQSLPPKANPPVHRRLNAAGDAPLHLVARRCAEVDGSGEHVFHEMLQYGVLNRADPTQPNAERETPIMAAAIGGHAPSVSFLCRFTVDEYGANPALQAVNSCGENAFVVAARHGQVAALAALQEAGIDVHCVSRTRTTAVAEAAAGGHEGALRLLLGLGLDAGHKDLLGRSALHWAAKAGHARVCELLVEEFGCEVDEPDRGLATPLLGAVRSGRVAAARALVGLGADPEAAARDRSTPVSECGSEEMRGVLEEGLRWRRGGAGCGRVFVRRELAEAEAAAAGLVRQWMEEAVQGVVGGEKEEGWRKGRRRTSIAARTRRGSLGRTPSGASDASRAEEEDDDDAAVLARLQSAHRAASKEQAPSGEAAVEGARGAAGERRGRSPMGEYQRLPPVHRPPVERGLAAGSALHAQVLRRDQRAAYPRPVPDPPSRAATAAEALVEALGRDGPFQSVDLAWASMAGSPLWLAENRPTADLAAQRRHTLYLHALQRKHNALAYGRSDRSAPPLRCSLGDAGDEPKEAPPPLAGLLPPLADAPPQRHPARQGQPLAVRAGGGL